MRLKANQTNKISQFQQKVNIVVHASKDINGNIEEMIMDLKQFPGLHEGNYIEIFHTDNPNNNLILQAMCGPVQKFPLSICKPLAETFELQARREVVVRAVQPETAGVAFIELWFKNQYVSRGDFWLYRSALLGSCVYPNKIITCHGIRCQVTRMLSVNGADTRSGVITANTRFAFRSRSAKTFLMIQLSREMWDFADDGQLYFEKAVDSFLAKLVKEWQQIGAEHVITICFFSRSYFDDDRKTSRGRIYKDFYKIVFQGEVPKDASAFFALIKKEFNGYPAHINWKTSQTTVQSGGDGIGVNSNAAAGNVLEAINLCLNRFDGHYIDRDLTTTGLGIVVISAGSGVSFTDANLVQVTKRRMVDKGVNCDYVCLSRSPLHAVPLFLTPKLIHNDAEPYFYHIPHWLHISFYRPDSKDPHAFIPRCAIPSSEKPDLLDIKQTPALRDFFGSIVATASHHQTSSSQIPSAIRSSSSEECLQNTSTFRAPSSFGTKIIETDAVDKEEDYGFGSSVGGLQVGSSSRFPAPIVNLASSIGKHTNISTISTISPHATGAIRHSSSSSVLSSMGNGGASKSLHKGNIQGSDMDEYDDKVFKSALNVSRVASREGLHQMTTASSSQSLSQADKKDHEESTNKPNIDTTSHLPLKLNQPALKQHINPFNEKNQVKPVEKLKAHNCRWNQIFLQQQIVIRDADDQPNWKSLMEPAILPLNSDYMPDPADLQRQYIEYPAVRDSYLPAYSNISALMAELVYQRLLQDFQLISGSSTATKSLLPSTSNSAFYSAASLPPTIYLSLGHEIHSLSINFDKKLEIKCLVRNEAKPVPIDYSYTLWCPFRHSYHKRVTTSFTRKTIDRKIWDKTDLLICGFDDDVSDLNQSADANTYGIPDCVCPRSVTLVLLPFADDDNGSKDKETLSRECSEPGDDGDPKSLRRTMSGTPHLGSSDAPRAAAAINAFQKFAKSLALKTTRPIYPFHDVHIQDPNATAPYSGPPHRCFLIQIDPEFCERDMWMWVRYDGAFHWNRCFHIEIRWLVCSAVLVEDFTQSCIRRAKQSMFTLIRLPLKKLSSSTIDPFAVTADIPISSPQLLPFIFNKLLVNKYSIESISEVDDGDEKKQMTRFVHVSGKVMVCVKETVMQWGWIDLVPDDTTRQLFQDIQAMVETNGFVTDIIIGIVDSAAEQR